MRQTNVRTHTSALVACLLLTAGACFGSKAEQLYKEGLRAERAGQNARAYLLYSQAAALDPDNRMYWLRSQALRSRAAVEAKVVPKISGLGAAVPPAETSPQEPHFSSVTERDLADARKPLPPAELHATPGVRDFDIRGDFKTVFNLVAQSFGLEVVFDTDYQPGRRIRFEMDHVNYREALRGLESATDSFIVPLSPKLFLVAKDTQEKRRDVEPYVSVSVPISETTSTQDLTALITAVRQATGLQKVAWDTQDGVVVLRGPLSMVVAAWHLFQELMVPPAQVVVDMEFIEVSRSDMLKLGLSLPNSFPFYWLTNWQGNLPNLAKSITNLVTFGGGNTLIGVALADAAAIAQMSRGRGHVLLRSTLRAGDGKAATLHVGDKYPIMTAGYFGPASFQGANAYTPPPSFQFEDLGLTMKVTPKVHGIDSVTLDLESEFKVLTGQEVDGIPVISNRQLKCTFRVRTGVWAVIAGLMQNQEARTIAGLAGVSRVPVLRDLTSSRTRRKDSSEVLVVLRPRLLTLPPDQIVSKTIYIGTENRPLTPM